MRLCSWPTLWTETRLWLGLCFECDMWLWKLASEYRQTQSWTLATEFDKRDSECSRVELKRKRKTCIWVHFECIATHWQLIGPEACVSQRIFTSLSNAFTNKERASSLWVLTLISKLWAPTKKKPLAILKNYQVSSFRSKVFQTFKHQINGRTVICLLCCCWDRWGSCGTPRE